jgi:8-oxo-dGTP diphosphatase
MRFPYLASAGIPRLNEAGNWPKLGRGEMIRRFGEPPEKRVHYRLRPGAYGILLQGRRMLVTYQSAPFDEFQLPGGGIDPGENAIQALHREVREETGWGISQPRRLGAFRRFVHMPEYDQWSEKICHIFVARPVMQYGPPTEPDHTDIWLDIDAAAQMLANHGDRHFLERYSASPGP